MSHSEVAAMPNLPNIVRQPHILCGKPTIEGTRISVELILEHLGSGWSEQQIYKSLPTLPPGSVQAACAFAAELVETQFQAAPAKEAVG